MIALERDSPTLAAEPVLGPAFAGPGGGLPLP
jgi:hypothetical protein